MNIFEIINKSQKKIKLSKEDIFWLVAEFTKDEIPDYQMSTWLGTVFINHLSEDETSWLTQALSESGERLKWSMPTVDKHSTGGVGDKTSLIIAPLMASLGYKIPMMAGRGLGHTGGTIDKLESIDFQTDINVKTFKKLVEEHGVCIMGQSEDFCPADKRLYALRDATHTVANIPLICSSIMSKKIAEGLNGLVLDIKFGSGAFMNQFQDAKSLAQKLIAIGENNNIKTFGVLSSMNQPLGRYIGNKLEILECVEIMKNPKDVFEKYEDTIVLSLLLSALMIEAVAENKNPDHKLKSTLEKSFKTVFDQLMSGKVFEKFVEMVSAQNGDLHDFISEDLNSNKNPVKNLNPKNYIIDYKMKAQKITLTADSDGVMNYLDVKVLGFAAVALGAGRLTKNDQIDFEVGFYCYKKQGDAVKKYEGVFDVYYNNENKLSEALVILNQSFKIDSNITNNKTSNLKSVLLTKPTDLNLTVANSYLIQEIISFDGKEYNNIHLKTKFFEV